MLTIHKFIIGYGTIEVPKSAALLKIAVQHDEITAWYCVDTDEHEFIREHYYVIGTGQNMDSYPDIDYVDTVFTRNGLVWHIYKELT